MSNPEFRRNLWLEFSPRRFVLMLGVLGIIGALTAYLSQDMKGGAIRNLGIVFAVLGSLLVGGWGSFAVVHSIGSEISERTWDQQRLSALSPWQMAWGKLFGASIYPWSGGLVCAAVVLVCGLMGSNPPRAVLLLAAALIGHVALHCWLMASRLHTMDANATNPSSTTVQRLFGLFILLQVLPGFVLFGLMRQPDQADSTGSWWGLPLGWSSMSLLMASFALALGLLALWRTMSAQLLVRSAPWAWLLGCVSVGIIAAGFIDGPATHFLWPGVIAAISLLACYFAIFTEKNNGMVWRAVAYYARQGQWQRLLQALPLWPVSLVLALVCTGLYTVLLSMRGSNGFKDLYHVLPALLTMTALHTLRDMGIYLFFAWRNTTRKPAGMALLVYALLGYVLPMFAGFGSSQFALVFEPLYGIRDDGMVQPHAVFGPLAWAAMLAHLAIVAALLGWRWQKSVRLNLSDKTD